MNPKRPTSLCLLSTELKKVSTTPSFIFNILISSKVQKLTLLQTNNLLLFNFLYFQCYKFILFLVFAFFERFISFIYVWVFACMYDWIPCVCLVPTEARRECWISRNWNYNCELLLLLTFCFIFLPEKYWC